MRQSHQTEFTNNLKFHYKFGSAGAMQLNESDIFKTKK